MANVLTNFLAEHFGESSPIEFYRDMFPCGKLASHGVDTKGLFRASLIQIKESEAKRISIHDDLKEIQASIKTDDFIVISPVDYAGNSQKQTYARNLYALIFDLDGVIIKDDNNPIGLRNLLYQMDKEANEYAFIPKASYIVSSGTGLHIVYMLDKPLPLYESVIRQLNKLRSYLTKTIWNQYITELSESPQYESCTQGFRAVGSLCKDKTQRVRAFKIGKRISIDEINGYLPDEYRLKTSVSHTRLDECKIKYPEWYEKRIIKGQPKNTWIVSKNLYYWWLEKIKKEAISGHRYFCVMALAIYARKCGIDFKQLEKDAFSLIPLLDSRTVDESNHFDGVDVVNALSAYKARYITFPRATIERITGITIPANKRNYRKQSDHMVYLNGMNRLKKSLGEPIGRPSKRDLILEYIRSNPDAKPKEIAQSLGVSLATVYRHRKELD